MAGMRPVPGRQHRKSKRKWFVLLILLAFCATVITLGFNSRNKGIISRLDSNTRSVIDPLQNGIHSLLLPIGNFVSGIFNYNSVVVENKELKNQVAKLKSELAKEKFDEIKYQELQSLENLPFDGSIPKVFAEVISNSVSNYQLSITLDRGSNQGIAAGMPVVTAAGLVGIVNSTTPNESNVLLITDTSSTLSVQVESKKGTVSFALATGNGSSLLNLSFLTSGSAVAKNDVVFTSSQENGMLPAGIPIGKVNQIELRPGSLEKTITVNPYADLDSLDYVVVLQWLQSP
jgi:rod shape-determining protein MreC